MNEPHDHSSKQKLIALGVVGFLAVTGGIYLFSKHRSSSQAPDGSVVGQADQAAQPATTGAGSSGAAPGSAAHSASTLSPSSPGANGGSSIGAIAPVVTGSGAGTNPSSVHGKNIANAPLSIGGVIPGATPALPAPAGGAPLTTAGTTNGASALTSGATPGAQSLPAPAAPEIEHCVTVSYNHKASNAHPDEESCSHHKNMLKLPEVAGLEGKKIAPSSVCVRVNGTPVHYLTVKGRPNELIFGAVAGPKSKVTVRYCTGLAQGCAKEDCSVPKDEFMEAIGGSDGKGQDARLGQWDPSAAGGKETDVMAKLDSTVKRELESNDELNGRAPAGELYKDWLGQAETTACGITQAKN